MERSRVEIRILCSIGAFIVGCGGTPPPASPQTETVSPEPAVPPSEAAETPETPAEAEPETEEDDPLPNSDKKREEYKAKPKRDPQQKDPEGTTSRRAGAGELGFIAPVLRQQATALLRLHFLDVGQGDSTLIECPDGSRILVDGGSGISSSSSPQTARDQLLEALGASQMIDTVIVSHPDRDHYNALPFLLDDVTVGHVQVVGAANQYSGPFVTWFDALPASQKTRITAESHDAVESPSETLDCGSASVHVLSVAAKGSPDNSPKNSLSLVLLVSYGEFDTLLTADATFLTETRILSNYPKWWLEVEVLKLGHHGSSTTSSGPDWIAATSPEVAVVSSGLTNPHGHPREGVVKRVADETLSAAAHPFRWYGSQTEFDDLAKYTEAIYGTGTNGTIVVESDGARYWVEREK